MKCEGGILSSAASSAYVATVVLEIKAEVQGKLIVADESGFLTKDQAESCNKALDLMMKHRYAAAKSWLEALLNHK